MFMNRNNNGKKLQFSLTWKFYIRIIFTIDNNIRELRDTNILSELQNSNLNVLQDDNTCSMQN